MTEDTAPNPSGTSSAPDLPPGAPADAPAAPAPAGANARAARWCAMLLDMSRRNRLLNFRDGPGAVRLSHPDPALLEDALSDGRTHRILERPDVPEGALPVDQTPEFLVREAAAGRLYAAADGAEARKRLLALGRAARTDLEEGGACTLFVALGVLHWRDGDGPKAPAYRAPLILCPVELKKLPGKGGFSLRRADEELVPNVTLLEMLRRERRMEVPGADPMPEDGHGVNVPAVFEAYRKAVSPMAGWSVEPEIWLGRFSFGKFLMWRDLSENLDALAQSPVVAHLLRGGGAFEDTVGPVEPSGTDAATDREWPPCPLAADSSQLSAVIAAAKGRSFVLHGPPGTGKSQTIANLISCCLSAGKTVLFVAEKRAALEVVHRRLCKVGLGPFCLELHSNKAGKADVMRQFSEALEFAGARPPEEWDADLEALRSARRSLQGGVDALHAGLPCGLTPYRAIAHLLSRDGADGPKAAGMEALGDIPVDEPDAYEGAARLAAALGEAAAAIPEELFEPLAPLAATEWTPSFADALVAAARDVPAAAEALLSAAAALPGGGEWKDVAVRLEARQRGRAGEAAFAAAWPGLDPDKAAALDVAALRAAAASIPERFFLARPFAMRSLRKVILAAARPLARLPLPAAALPGLFDALDALRAARADAAALPECPETQALEGAWARYRDVAASFAGAGAFDLSGFSPDALSRCAAAVMEHAGKLRQWCRFRALTTGCAAAGIPQLAAAVESGAVLPADAEAALRLRWCERFARIALDRSEPLRSFFGDSRDSLVDRFRQLDGELASLSRRMVLSRLSLALLKARRDRDLAPQFALLARETQKKTRVKAPRALLEAIPGALPALKPCLLASPLSVAQYLPPGGRLFDVVVFDEASQLTVPDAIGALARGRQAVIVGDPRQLPPTSFFLRSADSAGEEGDAAPAADDIPEDLDSILDECKAAGVPEQALLWHYRSRHESLIAFSNRRYYEGRLFTFPSAAAAGSGLGVRRVKVEGAVYDRAGTRTNRKEAEAVAAAVVERLLDPAFADKSCGVVTFSQAQQNLIEDLLDDAQAAHPEIQPFFDVSRPEPVFVKNLENVQGDERDAIYFSIGYAPDATGAFAMNFGPLNRPGGERRLNVAVTRAKEQVVVFSSFDPSQIDLSRTQAVGAAHLREFLEHADRCGAAARGAGFAGGGGGKPADPFVAEVADFLRTAGFAVDADIGCSGYRVDLAVRAKDGASHVLAVECDGAAYRDAATVRDRDESRVGVLQGLGWRVARCWILEWWLDREKAESKLLAAATAAVEGTPPPPASGVVAAPAGNVVAAALPADPQAGGDASSGAALAAEWRAVEDAPDQNVVPYVPAPLDASYAKAPSNFNATYGLAYVQQQMLRIIRDEGPITDELLFARVLAEWGMKEPTDNRLKVLKKALPKNLPSTTRAKLRTWWPEGADPASWRTCRVPAADTPERARRSLRQIPFEEWAAAFDALSRTEPDARGDDALRAALRLFGLPARITPDARTLLEAAQKAARAFGKEGPSA